MSRKHPCSYCGDAQASHVFLWWDALINTLLAKLPAPEYLFSFLISSRMLGWLLDTTTAVALSPLRMLGVIRFFSTPSKSTSPRTRALWDEARRRGYRMEQAFVFGMPSGLCRVYTHEWHYFNTLPDILSRSYLAAGNIDDKDVFKSALMRDSLPVPEGASFLRIRPALRFFRARGSAVIVKPRFGSRARHTSLDIRDEQTFVHAMHRAFQISPWCMVEEFIPGDLYRATCVGGRLIGVVHFIKPAIAADGEHTVRELLDMHNAQKKHPNMTDVRADRPFSECLERQGLTAGDRPERGRIILLAEHSERPNGGYFVDCTDEIPRENRELIERAARAAHVPVVGLDIISRDIRRPHTVERMVFIEGNRAPFIELHEIPYEGTPRNVAAALWDLWEESRRKDKRHEHEPRTEEDSDAGRRDNDEIDES